MVGSLFAWLSIALALSSFFVEERQVVAALLGAVLAALIAVWRRGRPVFLLLSFVLFSLAFLILPSGMDRMVMVWIPQNDWIDRLHEPLVLFSAFIVVAILFAVACRRQSGGVWLSAQEASEDLAKFIGFMGYLASLLFLPLLLLPFYLAYNGTNASFDIETISWQRPEWLFANVGGVYLSWFTALLLMSGLGVAYMHNAHHRCPCSGGASRLRRRAWREFIGGALFLLPICWTAVKQGCLLAIEVHQGGSINIGPALLVAGVDFPVWALIAVFPATILLLSLAAISVMLRSLVYLFGPHYLKKRAASHIDAPVDVAGQRNQFRPSRFGNATEGRGR
ncbi:hypothetical protein [uncultured Cohaesibacter sp.]|uniref:hypothetical protein n=1 Tax=uncultured Cohaesibacter sp. TaxID=1002546 RepID=UPI0029C6D3EA|nr:hypothetical protein [uncultured Cohaesibacter sp.]